MSHAERIECGQPVPESETMRLQKSLMPAASPFSGERATLLPMDDRAPDPALHLCVYTRAWRTSGTGLFAQELVNGLVNAGAEVTFVSPPIDNPEMEAPRPGLRRLRPVREIVTNAPPLMRALRSLRRILGGYACLLRARFHARTFIVSIPDPIGLFVPMMLLLRLTGARLIFIAHDPVPHCWHLSASWRWLEKGVHEASYRLSSVIVVLSEATRSKLQEQFPRVRTPVEVIEHGDFAFRDVTPLPGNGQLLMFGTLRRNKGVREAIEGCIAARRAGAPIHLVVAGEPYFEEKEYAEECRKLGESAPDAVTVRIGYVSDVALPGLIASTDAFVMPYTDFFSQSGVALLAASNARPIIATRAGGISALIDEGMPSEVIAKPVTAGNVFDAVMRYARTSRTEWAERTLAYREVTLERRSWSAIARRYAALANKIAG